MNLQDFTDTVSRIILQRGLAYYQDGAVDSLAYLQGKWTAVVAGTQEYTVHMKISDSGDIMQNDCDCPYDQDMCKHQVAVLYALRDRLSGKVLSEDPSRQNLKNILAATDKDDIIAFLLHYAVQNPAFREAILFRFSENPNAVEYARYLIKTSIKDAMGIYGYIDNVKKAVSGANNALTIMRSMSRTDQALPRIALGILIIQEMLELENQCDDSGTHIGNIIANTLGLFQKTAEELAENDTNTEQVFTLLFDHAFDPVYKHWRNWQTEAVKACIPLCGLPHLRRKLESRLPSMNPDEAQRIRQIITARFGGDAR